MAIVLLYALVLAVLVGMITSASFAAAVLVGIAGYVIGRWRAVDSPSRVQTLGDDVSLLPKAYMRRVCKRAWWWFS